MVTVCALHMLMGYVAQLPCVYSSSTWSGYFGYVQVFEGGMFFWTRNKTTVVKEIYPRCKLIELVILDFSEIFFSQKLILKVDILMTGVILSMYGSVFPTLIILK